MEASFGTGSGGEVSCIVWLVSAGVSGWEVVDWGAGEAGVDGADSVRSEGTAVSEGAGSWVDTACQPRLS